MLYIEQASAGSGKTFALAKTYIRDLLAERPMGQSRYRLRNPESLSEAHGHILAVTFTNKATNEMKQRIVQKLAALAEYKPGDKKPDYLDDFVNEFGEDEQRIVLQAKMALQSLLHEYADFRVSTIDSFFQTVMRSFTAEIDELSDSYQVELDDKMVSQRSVDATMSQLKENDETRAHTVELRKWVQMLIDRNVKKGESWNPFSSKSIYGSLKRFAQLTSSEAFKRHENELNNYFDEYGDRFRTLFTAIMDKADSQRREAHDKFATLYRAAASMPGFEELTVEKGISLTGVPKFLKQAGKAVHCHFPPSKIPTGANLDGIISGDKTVFKVSLNKKGEMQQQYPGLNEAVRDMMEAFYAWVETDRLWHVSTAMMPDLALLSVVMANRREFLNENNLLPLSSTNQILRSIICEDDAPFIYERIGAYIDHYLIDEFQDTSRMQWDNFRPLLLESLSRGCDNLIIGDVKQSIYRFRNAEPKLISEIVPGDTALAKARDADGTQPSQSTNWRSAAEIVRFNNSIFKLMAQYINPDLTQGLDLTRLYGNVVQKVRHTELPGYVCVNFGKSKKGELAPGVAATPGLIVSILGRGYRQSDIAILVNTRAQASDVIDTITAYNAELGKDQTPINIVSDESLKVSSSEAVQNIISVLEMMRHPLRESDRASDINLLISRYHHMRRLDASMPFDDIVQNHVDNAVDPIDIEQMLHSMRSMSLPSLIEAIAGLYLSDYQRKFHAAYIAALQDMVLDYCESQPADVASFLSWWHEYGEERCINSPETTDAVKVMTIHKSKGLEFECVILPLASWSYGPSGKDTLWVKPSLPAEVDTDGIPLPPVIAVSAREILAETPYAQDYSDYCRDSLVDSLNKTYVAYTRAKRELHIWCEPSTDLSAPTLANIMAELMEHVSETSQLPDPDCHIDMHKWKVADSGACYEYGEPTCCQGGNTDTATDNATVSYCVLPDRDILHCTAAEDEIGGDTEEEDSFSVGVIMHEVMSRVRVASDLKTALLKASVQGKLTRDEQQRWFEIIDKQISEPGVTEWFNPGLRVINERAILLPSGFTQRPDRVVVDQAGNVTVIDYKFGEQKSTDYIDQVRGYMRLLKNSIDLHPQSVRGYIWYVALKQIVEVEI